MSCQPPAFSALRSLASSAWATRAASTCPPRNPMLIFCGFSSSLMSMILCWLDDFGQHPTAGPGVQEGDPRSADARTRLLVDQAQPRAPAGLERRLDRGDAVRDVMQAGAP